MFSFVSKRTKHLQIETCLRYVEGKTSPWRAWSYPNTYHTFGCSVKVEWSATHATFTRTGIKENGISYKNIFEWGFFGFTTENRHKLRLGLLFVWCAWCRFCCHPTVDTRVFVWLRLWCWKRAVNVFYTRFSCIYFLLVEILFIFENISRTARCWKHRLRVISFTVLVQCALSQRKKQEQQRQYSRQWNDICLFQKLGYTYKAEFKHIFSLCTRNRGIVLGHTSKFESWIILKAFTFANNALETTMKRLCANCEMRRKSSCALCGRVVLKDRPAISAIWSGCVRRSTQITIFTQKARK